MSNNKKKTLAIIVTGIILLVFRFLMGLSKFGSEDELQIYLIGLKSYLTETFPYFGPDVVYTHSQIPGALQGLLVAEPLKWLGIPEAPYVLLNILSFSALIFFAWYLTKRIGYVPKWFTYVWILTSPWTLHYSTHIENPSYVIVGAILFFVSIFELGGFYKSKIIPYQLSYFFIGFSIFWIMQLHLSWILTIPYFAWVCWENRSDKKTLIKGLLFFALGAAISMSTLIPTLLSGFGSGDVENNIVFNYKNGLEIPTIILRFFMFASYEITRFIGYNTTSRLAYLQDQMWVTPVFLVLLIVGFFQVFYFVFSLFKSNDQVEWKKVKLFTVLSLALLCCSFLFSISEPRSHTFYLLYPVAIWYSFYCYSKLFTSKIKKVLVAFIVCGVLFQTSLFINRYDNRSFFANKERINHAIDNNDYTLLAARRSSSIRTANKENLWSKTSPSIRFNDFEVNQPYFKPQNIVSNEQYKGKYSCKIDSLQTFSVTFSENLETLNHPTKVKMSFWAKTNQLENYILVYEIGDDQEKSWNSKSIGTSSKSWELIEMEINLPSYENSNTELVMYVWMNNKAEGQLNIDDWTIVFE